MSVLTRHHRHHHTITSSCPSLRTNLRRARDGTLTLTLTLRTNPSEPTSGEPGTDQLDAFLVDFLSNSPSPGDASRTRSEHRLDTKAAEYGVLDSEERGGGGSLSARLNYRRPTSEVEMSLAGDTRWVRRFES